jgi:hypothetical protein
MQKRSLIVVVVATLVVAALAAFAIAEPAPATLTATKTLVTYPQSSTLISQVTTAGYIMQRVAGASDWTTFAAVGEGETSISVKPKYTTAYQVVAGVASDVQSEVVTIGVKAKLTKPQIGKRNVGHKGHGIVVKGNVQPLFAGTVDLTFYRWEKVTTYVPTLAANGKAGSKKVTKNQWVQHGDSVSVTLKRQNSQMSKWSYKWTPSAKGTWKVVVSQSDVAHELSSTYRKAIIKR